MNEIKVVYSHFETFYKNMDPEIQQWLKNEKVFDHPNGLSGMSIEQGKRYSGLLQTVSARNKQKKEHEETAAVCYYVLNPGRPMLGESKDGFYGPYKNKVEAELLLNVYFAWTDPNEPPVFKPRVIEATEIPSPPIMHERAILLCRPDGTKSFGPFPELFDAYKYLVEKIGRDDCGLYNTHMSLWVDVHSKKFIEKHFNHF